jgi:hypothetical protein
MSDFNFDMLSCIAHIAERQQKIISRIELAMYAVLLLVVVNTIHHW